MLAILMQGIKNEESYDIYKKLLKGDNIAKKADGTPFIGEVWPGDCVFPDFTNESTRFLILKYSNSEYQRTLGNFLCKSSA